jgi:protein-L-isoaspartate O-methyltransferase
VVQAKEPLEQGPVKGAARQREVQECPLHLHSQLKNRGSLVVCVQSHPPVVDANEEVQDLLLMRKEGPDFHFSTSNVNDTLAAFQ